jgi:hypothetical protein
MSGSQWIESLRMALLSQIKQLTESRHSIEAKKLDQPEEIEFLNDALKKLEPLEENVKQSLSVSEECKRLLLELEIFCSRNQQWSTTYDSFFSFVSNSIKDAIASQGENEPEKAGETDIKHDDSGLQPQLGSPLKESLPEEPRKNGSSSQNYRPAVAIILVVGAIVFAIVAAVAAFAMAMTAISLQQRAPVIVLPAAGSAGIPIATANADAQIENLTVQVQALQTQIGNLSEQIRALQLQTANTNETQTSMNALLLLALAIAGLIFLAYVLRPYDWIAKTGKIVGIAVVVVSGIIIPLLTVFAPTPIYPCATSPEKCGYGTNPLTPTAIGSPLPTPAQPPTPTPTTITASNPISAPVMINNYIYNSQCGGQGFPTLTLCPRPTPTPTLDP